MKKCYILRGVSGAGKSALASQIQYSDGAVICEADSHFMDEYGNYLFNPRELQLAHDKCKDTFKKAIERGLNVVLSNTSTREWEFVEYIELAEKSGYMVFSLIVENRHGGVNDKGIGAEVLNKMKERFEIKL